MEKHRRLPIIKLPDPVVQKIFYALPRISSVSLFAPIHVVQGIYAKHYGLSLTTIAGILLFARLFDAITDPVIGYLSDKSRIKTGTRKPTMILGAAVLVSSAYFLYSPPENVSALYFAFWFMAFYLGYTLFEIPYLAWGGEISHSSHEKNQTYLLRTATGYVGMALFYCIPLLPIWGTTEITPEILKFFAIVSGLLMLPLLYFCMKRVPDGRRYHEEISAVGKSGRLNQAAFRPIVNEMIHNRPLLLFFGAFLFAGSGLGMWMGLYFIYVDAYLNMGALFAEVTLISILVSMLGALILIKIAKHLGKQRTWLLSMLLGLAVFIYTACLDPGNAGYWALLTLAITMFLCFVSVEALAKSMLSDIIDYSFWKFRTYRNSTYFALYMLIYKGAGAIGAAIGLAIASWYGFDPSMDVQTESGIDGLKLAMSWVPLLLVIISMIFVTLSPITTRRHDIIRRRLDTLDARSKKEKVESQVLDKDATEALLTSH